ncbi:hypothetical protein [Streptomyces sp. Y7]|uniref:hypothetical protein n=1 Tax=Streptomyces sp. Y7 TaxID=3342392 RepID=UPI003713BC65
MMFDHDEGDVRRIRASSNPAARRSGRRAPESGAELHLSSRIDDRVLAFGNVPGEALAEDARFELVRGCPHTLSNCGGGVRSGAFTWVHERLVGVQEVGLWSRLNLRERR